MKQKKRPQIVSLFTAAGGDDKPIKGHDDELKFPSTFDLSTCCVGGTRVTNDSPSINHGNWG